MTNMPGETHEIIKEIKKSLRLAMNGVVSTLQRRQGLDYKINFGVEIPRLKGIAAEYPKKRELAETLWKENIRECKLLAIMLMPQEEYSDIAEKWVTEVKYPEIAEHLAMSILCRLPDAAERALDWCGRDGMAGQCGFLSLSNIMRNGGSIDIRHEKRLVERFVKLVENETASLLAHRATGTIYRYLDNTDGAAARILAEHNNLPGEFVEMLQEYTQE